jgi:hypothetical protein
MFHTPADECATLAEGSGALLRQAVPQTFGLQAELANLAAQHFTADAAAVKRMFSPAQISWLLVAERCNAR